MKRMILPLALALLPLTASADWVLSGAESKLSFGSIKKDAVGEAHHFAGLSGSVDDAGMATVTVDLSSVETWIDIRNERMAEFVFAGLGDPTITGSVDIEALSALAPGASMVSDLEASLAFGDADISVEGPVFVTRLTDTRAMITSDEMIFVNVADLGVTAGIDKLMELAELPSITRVVPVTFRLVFDEVQSTASAPVVGATVTSSGALETSSDSDPVVTASAEGSVDGDADAGAKVFRKCKACHVVDEEKNRVGPHLVGIIGRQAASIDGYKYSDAFQELDYEWTVERLTEYLRDPKGYVKGTKMSFAGLKKDEDIVNVIAYLAGAE